MDTNEILWCHGLAKVNALLTSELNTPLGLWVVKRVRNIYRLLYLFYWDIMMCDNFLIEIFQLSKYAMNGCAMKNCIVELYLIVVNVLCVMNYDTVKI